MIKTLIALVALSLIPRMADASCAAENACLCVAQNPSHAALRVLPSSVNVGFVNVSAVLYAGDCSFDVGDTIDVSSENDDDQLFASYPELIVGLDCGANLRGFIVLQDDEASCVESDFTITRDEAITLNSSEECTTEVNDVAPNPPCDDLDEGCCATTAPSTTPWWMLAVALTLLRLRRGRRLSARRTSSASTPR